MLKCITILRNTEKKKSPIADEHEKLFSISSLTCSQYGIVVAMSSILFATCIECMCIKSTQTQ